MTSPVAARVAVDALGMTPTSYGHLQQMAARYARLRLDGHSVVNRQTRAPIMLAWSRGLENVTAPGIPPALLLAVPAIPAMVAAARYVGALASRSPPPDVVRYHAFAAAVEVGDRRLDVALIARENRRGMLFLDRLLGREAPPQRGVGGASPDETAAAMPAAADTPNAEAQSTPQPGQPDADNGVGRPMAAPSSAPALSRNVAATPAPSPQSEGWFHSLLASIGLAPSGDKAPPAPTPPSDDQKPIDYPPPPPPKPEWRRVPDVDEEGRPNYLPGDSYPRYERTRPPPEPGLGERAWEGFKGGLQQPEEEDIARRAFNFITTPMRAGFGAVEGALGMPQGAIMDVLPGIVGGEAPRVPRVAPRANAVLDAIAEGKPAEAAGRAAKTGAPAAGPPPPEGQWPPSAATARPEPAASPRAGDAEPSSPQLQAPGGKGSGSPSFRDRLDDFKRFREEKSLDGVNPSDHNDAARQYVMQRQGDTQAEHVAIYDGNANAITHAGTSFEKGQVALPAEVDAKIRDPAERMTIHHSHPGSGGLSRDDLKLTPRPGTAWVVAHDEKGDLSAARLTPEATTALRSDNEFGQKRAQKIITDLWNRADRASGRAMNQAKDRGEFTREEGDRIQTEIVNRALADAGVIEYVTTHSLPSHPVIERMRTLANAAIKAHIPNAIPELANHVPDSPTQSVGIDEGMARISGQDDATAAGRPGRASGGRIRSGRAGSAQWQGDGGRHRGSLRRPAQGERQTSAGGSGRGAEDEERRISTTIPRVTGHELEMAPTSYGHLQMMTARYARAHLDGRSVVNRETHAPIALTWKRGIDQIAVPGKSATILLAVPAIPEMLAQARYLGSAPDPQHRPDVSRVHGFASAVEIGGRRLDVVMVVRENRQGQLTLDRMAPYAAAGALANSAMQTNIPKTIPELTNHVLDSPTEPVGIREGMARISGQDDATAAGRPGRASGGRSGSGRAGYAQRQGDGGRHRRSLPSPARRELQASAGGSGRRAEDEEGRVGATIPRVTGHELEAVPTSYGHLQMMTARYARAHLDGRSVVNRETHAPIALDWQRGIDQIATPGKPAAILLAVPAIPEMLANAEYLGSAPDPQHRADVSRVHGFASAVEIGGRRLDVVMIVRENRQGRLVLDRMESYAAADRAA
jgi:proteasome lid subunit RPN8/RPN11